MRPLATLALLSLTSCQTTGLPAGSLANGCDNPAARGAVRQAVQSFYDALRTDDAAAFQRATTPDFFAYEIGKRYTGQELRDIIAKDHADGQIINWNLGPMTMHVDCTVATAAWENNGSSGRQGKLKPRAWLESAVLRRQGDRWVMTFLHSTPKDPRP